MKNKLKCGEKTKRILTSAAAIAVIAVFYYAVGCPIRWLTGISCPSCGMTRAVFSLLTFDLGAAFYYHPLVFLLPIALITYLFRKRLPKKLTQVLFWLFIAVFIAVYVYRILSGSEIACVDFSSGLIYKLFSLLKGSV